MIGYDNFYLNNLLIITHIHMQSITTERENGKKLKKEKVVG